MSIRDIIRLRRKYWRRYLDAEDEVRALEYRLSCELARMKDRIIAVCDHPFVIEHRDYGKEAPFELRDYYSIIQRGCCVCGLETSPEYLTGGEAFTGYYGAEEFGYHLNEFSRMRLSALRRKANELRGRYETEKEIASLIMAKKLDEAGRLIKEFAEKDREWERLGTFKTLNDWLELLVQLRVEAERLRKEQRKEGE